MKSMMRKTTFREIKHSMGRYMAIFAIIALGVGFFAGIKITRPAMLQTADHYLQELDLFDYRMLSTLGITQEDVDTFSELAGVEYAEGSYYTDVIIESEIHEAGDFVAKIHSVPEHINGLSLVSGRLPEKSGECVLDARYYDEYVIGSQILLSDTNTEETLSDFSETEYTIVGTVNSAIYLNYERGTTSVGSGSVNCFIYILSEDFNMDCYMDLSVTMSDKYTIYTDDYQSMIDSCQNKMEETMETCTKRRSEELYNQAVSLAAAYPQMQMDESNLEALTNPNTYVLTRNSNIGYVCYESDSDIVEGVAVVFPVFFFLVAALVCVTTMNRMVEEQRTQIGILKALGYGKASIMGKYMIYSGSAAILGCMFGYFIGTLIFPRAIWIGYGLMYGFTEIEYLFSPLFFTISILVSLLCSIGTTWASCRYELGSMAAELIRPKSPQSGKRILLEHVPFLWKRLKFLYKVSIRNIVRYKKRLFMMILGIGGCTALIVTGYGLKDSIAGITDEQYGVIFKYDYQIGLTDGVSEDGITRFLYEVDQYTDSAVLVYQKSMEIIDKDNSKDITFIVPESEEGFEQYIHLMTSDEQDIAFPGYGEVVITVNIAEKYGIKKGDRVTFRDSSLNTMELTVSDITENFFMTYAYVSAETFQEQLNTEISYNTAYAFAADHLDIHEISAALMNMDYVNSVTVSQDIRERFSSMMVSLDYIVMLVIFSAAALAFIVLYNLTNINITERIREIATIKVLGFYPMETAAYVFRENMVLTALGALIGLPFGLLLHRFVMSKIVIDMVRFDIHIASISYWYAIIFTFAFTILVDIVMYFKLKRINMAESLKSIE